jgi:hypothetical protein
MYRIGRSNREETQKKEKRDLVEKKRREVKRRAMVGDSHKTKLEKKESRQ